MSDSLRNHVVLITGATSGIGLVATRSLLARGARVFATYRSGAKANQVFADLPREDSERLSVLPLELGDFDSVQACAERFLATGLPLHVLVNNAGLAGVRGRTSSGFESAFGVNHVGHFLLTRLLLDRLLASAPARIVNVGSRAHRRVQGIDFARVTEPTRSLTGIHEYNVSKLANLLFSAELGRRLAGTGVHTYALHPGVVDTPFWRAVPAVVRPLLKLRGMISPEAGARTLLHCVGAPELAQESGLYYADCQVATPTTVARDGELASLLWQRSVAWVRPALGPIPAQAVWDPVGP
ncbi:MAG: SDR family NAD(P)-dependent oxidoreductase [Myxococcales bacterium]